MIDKNGKLFGKINIIDLLIILVHKQRVQIAFNIHRREADDLVPFIQCSYVVIASQ